jgi:hypothetical protein
MIMAETQKQRGRPKGVESTHVMIRMPNDLLAQIDAYAETLEAQIGLSDVNVSRAMAIRELCKKGLQSLTSVSQPAPVSHANGQGAPTPQPTTQPAIPLALEPAPKSAPPVDVPQAAETPASAVQTPKAKRPAGHGLPPEVLERIAEERTHCEGLSLSQFAKRLHEKGIYSATAKDGSKVPPNKGNVTRWLGQAREAGLL